MKKKLSIALLAFSLAMLCASFLVRRIQEFFPPSSQEEEITNSFSPFGMIKQDLSAEDNGNEVKETVQPVLEMKLETDMPVQEQKEIVKPIFKIELTEEEQSAIENYAKNPKLQAFINELSGVISKEEIEQQNYLQIAFKPEVREIFMKYSQDKEFREIASQIMKDKNLLQLAKKAVKEQEVQK